MAQEKNFLGEGRFLYSGCSPFLSTGIVSLQAIHRPLPMGHMGLSFCLQNPANVKGIRGMDGGWVESHSVRHGG